jgi:hypothetical protein
MARHGRRGIVRRRSSWVLQFLRAPASGIDAIVYTCEQAE